MPAHLTLSNKAKVILRYINEFIQKCLRSANSFPVFLRNNLAQNKEPVAEQINIPFSNPVNSL